MDKKLREAQLKILNIFAKGSKHFALCGGTALELFYLNHRFSADLDFFSPIYDHREIGNLVRSFKKEYSPEIKLESEFTLSDRARVRFYVIPVQGSSRPLKLDFVEDIVFNAPHIKKFKGVRVYAVENIYLQKIFAIVGGNPEIDEIGRQTMHGRQVARDVFDIYMLSKMIMPLHLFLKGASKDLQRGMVHWYRTFPRQEIKLDLLDLDIYEKNFDSREMIIYLEKEIKEFMKEVLTR